MDTKRLWYFRRNALCLLLCGSSSSLQEMLCTSTTRLVRRSCTTGSASCCFCSGWVCQDLSSPFGLWHHVLLFFVSCRRTSVCACVFFYFISFRRCYFVVLFCDFFFLFSFFNSIIPFPEWFASLLLSGFCIWKIVKLFFPSSLIFARPNINSYDFFDLIWVVGITDFVLKFITIGLKCFVLFLPKILLAFKSRVGCSHLHSFMHLLSV